MCVSLSIMCPTIVELESRLLQAKKQQEDFVHEFKKSRVAIIEEFASIARMLCEEMIKEEHVALKNWQGRLAKFEKFEGRDKERMECIKRLGGEASERLRNRPNEIIDNIHYGRRFREFWLREIDPVWGPSWLTPNGELYPGRVPYG